MLILMVYFGKKKIEIEKSFYADHLQQILNENILKKRI